MGILGETGLFTVNCSGQVAAPPPLAVTQAKSKGTDPGADVGLVLLAEALPARSTGSPRLTPAWEGNQARAIA